MTKNKIIRTLYTILAVTIMMPYMTSLPVLSAPAATAAKKPAAAAVQYIQVSPLEVVCNPSKYLNKNISFEAEYVAFTALGLDYKPAFRDAEKYIGILIRRDDVKDNVIPLSEMKILIKRDMAEKYTDIETGDKVKIKANVYSTALGDPWLDVKEFSVTSAKPKTDKN